MNLDYKTFDSNAYKVDSFDSASDLLHMLSWQFYKKECAMTPRDDKWAESLTKIHHFIKDLNQENDDLYDMYFASQKEIRQLKGLESL